MSVDHKYVRELGDHFLQCRTIRHMWEIDFIGKVKDAENRFGDLWFRGLSRVMPDTYVRRVFCTRCAAWKEDFFPSKKAMLKAEWEGEGWRSFTRRYFYPYGYQWNGNERPNDRPRSQDYTEELFRRYSQR